MDKMKNFFRVSAEDFKKIPGSPIAYWLSPAFLDAFSQNPPVSQEIQLKAGLSTGDNTLFERLWFEVSYSCISFYCASLEETNRPTPQWYPCHSGGDFRKWYGNHEIIVNWKNNGVAIRNFGRETGKIRSAVRNDVFYFQPGLTWSKISSGSFSVRYRSKGFIFDDTGRCGFAQTPEKLLHVLGIFNSKIASSALTALSPTLSFTSGEIAKIPFSQNLFPVVNTKHAIENTQHDWDSYETSWDFQANPLLTVGNRLNSGGNQFDLSVIYIALRRDWQRQTEEMRRLEIENNRIFIDAYGLQDELSPEVPWNEITLTCNPWYRYGKSPEEISVSSEQWTVDSGEMPKDSLLEARLLEDTIKEFISYAVGCMMGRYSPEKPGLILANQGESFDDYASTLAGIKIHFQRESIPLNSPENFAKVREYLKDATWYGAVTDESGKKYSLIADRDGVIPILDEEWFVDDIVAQFKQFLRFTFGEEHFADNLDFIEKALGKDLRKYFIKDFYKDHVQRYKKRPIYWMFSSPKGSFNALIYMHRYRPDTVSIVLNEYLREFISKIRAKREHLIGDNNRTTLSPAEKTRNLKQIDKYAAMLTELDAYERDILYPLAQEKIAIDLDDGVKVNYVKFGAALKKIPGLEAKEE
jgi:hypothetical protein